MTMADMKLVRMLAERVGIKTVGDLEQFKTLTGVKTNEQLIKRLALYYGTNTTFEDLQKRPQTEFVEVRKVE